MSRTTDTKKKRFAVEIWGIYTPDIQTGHVWGRWFETRIESPVVAGARFGAKLCYPSASAENLRIVDRETGEILRVFV